MVLTWSIKHDQHRGIVGNKIIKSTVCQMHNISGNITPFFLFWGRGGRSRTTSRHKKNDNYYILDKGPWNSDAVHMNLYSSLFRTLHNVETWENFWIKMRTLFVGWGLPIYHLIWWSFSLIGELSQFRNQIPVLETNFFSQLSWD